MTHIVAGLIVSVVVTAVIAFCAARSAQMFERRWLDSVKRNNESEATQERET